MNNRSDIELKRDGHPSAQALLGPLSWSSLLAAEPATLCIRATPVLEELQAKLKTVQHLEALPDSQDNWRRAVENRCEFSLIILQADDPFDPNLVSFGLPLLAQSLRLGGHLLITTVPHDPKVTRRQVHTHLLNLCSLLGMRMRDDHFELGDAQHHHLPPGFALQRRDPWQELINGESGV